MYLVHVWFFIQYRVFDLDVFFIPAHLVFVFFIGFGVTCLLDYLVRAWRNSTGTRWIWATVTIVLVLFMTLAVIQQIRTNWQANDYSKDTAINDFYNNVWEMLPQNSVLLGRGGVFGFDMFYWQLVYNIRPDVTLPMMGGARPNPQSLAGRPLYTNEPAPSNTLGRRQHTPWSPSTDLMPDEAWYVPVLIGGGNDVGTAPGSRPGLTLYQVQAAPPQLTVVNVNPSFGIDQSLGSLTLIGYDLASNTVQPGGRLELKLYWQTNGVLQGSIVTSLGDLLLEKHELGLGNLPRYVADLQPNRNDAIIESYAIVVPATVTPGDYPLTISLQSRWPTLSPDLASVQTDAAIETITLTTITIKE
jgi:hypothetical protein